MTTTSLMTKWQQPANACMSECPMVSVVMVAYNSAKYIDMAIKGVVRQRTDFPIQLVVSDDASTDETPAIVEKWAQQYPDIIEYHRNHTNLGVQKNYLEAFKYCRGKYLAMCDADDYWTCHTKLARQVKYMENHPECAICYHRVINYYEETGEMSLSNGGGPKMQVHNAEELSKWNVITNMSVLSRRSLLDFDNLPTWLGEVRLLDYAMHLLIVASRPYATIHYMSRPMGVYRHSSQAIWTLSGMKARTEMAIDVRKHLIQQLSDRPEIVKNLEKACREMERVLGNPPQSPHKKRLISRLRAAISRLLPIPTP